MRFGRSGVEMKGWRGSGSGQIANGETLLGLAAQKTFSRFSRTSSLRRFEGRQERRWREMFSLLYEFDMAKYVENGSSMPSRAGTSLSISTCAIRFKPI